MAEELLSAGGSNQDSRTPTCGFPESDRLELPLEWVACRVVSLDRLTVEDAVHALAFDLSQAARSALLVPLVDATSGKPPARW